MGVVDDVLEWKEELVLGEVLWHERLCLVLGWVPRDASLDVVQVALSLADRKDLLEYMLGELLAATLNGREGPEGHEVASGHDTIENMRHVFVKVVSTTHDSLESKREWGRTDCVCVLP